MVFGRVTLWSARPNLLPLAVSTVAVKEGPSAGAGYGLYAGLLATLMVPATQGSYIFLYALLGAFSGFLFRKGFQQNFIGCLLGAGGSLLALNLLQMLFFLILGSSTLWALLGIIGPEFLWSLVCFPVIYGVYILVYRRVGGLKLM